MGWRFTGIKQRRDELKSAATVLANDLERFARVAPLQTDPNDPMPSLLIAKDSVDKVLATLRPVSGSFREDHVMYITVTIIDAGIFLSLVLVGILLIHPGNPFNYIFIIIIIGFVVLFICLYSGITIDGGPQLGYGTGQQSDDEGQQLDIRTTAYGNLGKLVNFGLYFYHCILGSSIFILLITSNFSVSAFDADRGYIAILKRWPFWDFCCSNFLTFIWHAIHI